jgi:hypothetical protein
MNEFVKQMSDPAWWISVVFVGLLINLASDYLKPLIDKFLGKFLAAKKRDNEKQLILFERDVQRLLDNPSKVTDLRFDILDFNLRTVLLIATSLAINSVLEIISPFNICFSIGPLLSAFVNMKNERHYRRVLSEYEKQRT